MSAGYKPWQHAVRCDDGGLDYCVTVPDENNPRPAAMGTGIPAVGRGEAMR